MKEVTWFLPIILFVALSAANAEDRKFTITGDGSRVEVRAPTCKGAKYTTFTDWGGDFYESWCLDRTAMARQMKLEGGLSLNGIYEKVVEKVIFWRGKERAGCSIPSENLIQLFSEIHKFYESKPELLYQDLDVGIGAYIKLSSNCEPSLEKVYSLEEIKAFAVKVNDIFMDSGLSGLKASSVNCYNNLARLGYDCLVFDIGSMYVNSFAPEKARHPFFSEAEINARIKSAIDRKLFKKDSVIELNKSLHQNLKEFLVNDIKRR